jgi:hypothetical protein
VGLLFTTHGHTYGTHDPCNIYQAGLQHSMRPSSGSTLSNLNRSSMDNSFWMSAFPLEEYPGSDRRLATVEPRQFLVLPCVRVVSSPYSFTSIFFRKYGRARRSGSTFGKDSSLLYSPVVTNSKILVSLLRENTKKQRCRAPSRGGPDGPLPFPGRPAGGSPHARHTAVRTEHLPLRSRRGTE